MEIITKLLGLIEVFKSSESGQKRRNLKLIRKTRRKLFKQYKKGGFTEDELLKLEKVDNAIVEALLELGEL
jgi:hypothetical protein